MLTFKINYSYLALVFLIIVSGFDVVSVNAAGANIRLSYFVFAIFFLKLYLFSKATMSIRELLFVLLLFACALFTLIYAENLKIGVAYSIWLLVNFFCVFLVFRALTIKLGVHFAIRAYQLAFRLQIIIAAFLFVAGVQERAHFLYYEPSYFVLASIPYLTIAVYMRVVMKHAGLLDLFLIMLMLLITKSAFLMLLILIIYTTVMLTKEGVSRSSIARLAVFTLAISIFSYLYVTFSNDLIARTIRDLIESPSVLIAALERSGNRWPRIQMVWDAIIVNFPYGIGPGNYERYSINFNQGVDYSNGLPWLEPRGKPAVNMWFEIIVELGIVAAILFLSKYFGWWLKARAFPVKHPIKIFSVILIVYFIAFMFESNYLRVYFWGILGVIAGCLKVSEFKPSLLGSKYE